jgi:hypothetical protein
MCGDRGAQVLVKEATVHAGDKGMRDQGHSPRNCPTSLATICGTEQDKSLVP